MIKNYMDKYLQTKKIMVTNSLLPKRLDRKVIYKSPWINLYSDKVQMPSGKIIEKYQQLDYQKESVNILLSNFKQEICLIKSLRYTTQKIEWELPCGSIEKDETILDAAKREALEETGFSATDLKIVHSYNPSNGMSNQTVHLVFGKVADENQNKFDIDEVKEVRWLPLTEIKKMISKNKISDGQSLLSLLLYLNKLPSHDL